MVKGVQANLRQARRVIAISDMHGNMGLFEKLLAQIQLSQEDILIIIGDFSNKGKECMEMTQAVYELGQKRNVYVLAGNGEYSNTQDFLSDPRWMLAYMKKWPDNLFGQWAGACGYAQLTQENITRAHAAILSRFSDQVSWLQELPWYLESENTIYVHAGMTRVPAPGEENPHALLKDDNYLIGGENLTGKTVVVGHWPVYNTGAGMPRSLPVIDQKRNIIGIDGGVGTKRFFCLNALIYEDGAYRTEFVHSCPQIRACRDIIGENALPPMQDDWPDYRLDVLKRNEHFSLCRKRLSGQTGLVKNEHIGQSSEGACYQSSSCSYFLNVRGGDKLALLDGGCSGYLFVMDETGQIGWIPKDAAKAD